MMRLKQLCMRLLLIVEMAGFGYLYICGNNGMQVLGKQRAVVLDVEKQIAQLKDEIEHLKADIYAWQTDDFYKEN